MKKFFIYCNVNQAYEALTYNDFLCSESKSDTFRVATLSFMSNRFIFLSSEKINAKGRHYGISEENNQYPVTFEVSSIQKYAVQARFVIRGADGKYHLQNQFRPLTDYYTVDDCIGAFIFGHVPFSLVSRIIFENNENAERFEKSGSELWFPKSIYAIWSDSDYRELPSVSIDTDILREVSTQVDSCIDKNTQDKLNDILLKRRHAKTAAYFAVEATANWTIGNIKTNVDSAIIKFLDDDMQTLLKISEQKLNELTTIFEFVDPNAYSVTDPALEDKSSIDYKLLITILEEISTSSYKIDKETVKHLQMRFEELCNNLIDIASYRKGIDAIAQFTSSRLGNAENMLKETHDTDIFYALAICIKNKGEIGKVKIETAEMNQNVKRYAFIIAGYLANMAAVSGSVKGNTQFELAVSNTIDSKLRDDMLICPIQLDATNVGIIPTVHITTDLSTFQNNINNASEDSLKAFYSKDFSDEIPEKEISVFKNPIEFKMDDKPYIINVPEDAERFRKELDLKLKRKKTTFNKDLFLKKIANEFSSLFSTVYHKYRG